MSERTDVDAVITELQRHRLRPEVEVGYGWPGQSELAVIDSVLSIQARYGRRRPDGSATGVLRRIDAFRATDRGSRHDDLAALALWSVADLSKILGVQKSHGRLKAELIIEVSGRLVNAGAVRACHIDMDKSEQRRAWTGVKGLGWVTWEYLGMLLGRPGVKADTMITRFVARSVGVSSINAKRARAAVIGAAKILKVDSRGLDHSIWRYERTL